MLLICLLQLPQLILGRFTFYAMIRGYFDLLKMTLKVMLLPWASGSKQIWMRSFKWGTVCFCRSNGCKVTSLQSLQSKKCWDILDSRLQFSRVYVVNRCSSGGPGSIPGHCKLWGPTILRPLGLQGQKLIFLKDLIYFYKYNFRKRALGDF